MNNLRVNNIKTQIKKIVWTLNDIKLYLDLSQIQVYLNFRHK